MQWSGPHAQILCRKLVPTIGPNDPAVIVAIPLEVVNLGMKQGIVIEFVLSTDVLAMGEYLRCMRVLF